MEPGKRRKPLRNHVRTGCITCKYVLVIAALSRKLSSQMKFTKFGIGRGESNVPKSAPTVAAASKQALIALGTPFPQHESSRAVLKHKMILTTHVPNLPSKVRPRRPAPQNRLLTGARRDLCQSRSYVRRYNLGIPIRSVPYRFDLGHARLISFECTRCWSRHDLID